jgi:hypothetical protein
VSPFKYLPLWIRLRMAERIIARMKLKREKAKSLAQERYPYQGWPKR